jgi:hypothetical protein
MDDIVQPCFWCIAIIVFISYSISLSLIIVQIVRPGVIISIIPANTIRVINISILISYRASATGPTAFASDLGSG